MKSETVLKPILKWLPSIAITPFYILNALDKLLDPNQRGKIVESSIVMMIAGIFILVATALYLYHRTMILGTSMLALYMICIVSIHIYKGKPAEIVMLILMATIFASYIRKPQWFQPQEMK